MSDDDRTTPLGLFNYARSYWQSAVLLHHARVKVTHPDAPVTLLLAHAIELYLKAFLRLRGVGIEEVRTTFSHDFKKLVDEASTRWSLAGEGRDRHCRGPHGERVEDGPATLRQAITSDRD